MNDMNEKRPALLGVTLVLFTMLMTVALGLAMGAALYYYYRRGLGRAPPLTLEAAAPAIEIIVGAAIISGLITLFVFNRLIKKPITTLVATAQRVTKGDAALRARVKQPAEFKELSDCFNKMLDSVIKAQSKADVDPLTGVFNYRYLHGYLKTQIRLAARYNRHLSVAVIDIDHFTQINDIYGHQEGDKVLKAAAGYIISQLRQVDHVARCGGEAFVVVMPETKAAPAMAVMERMRSDFSQKVFVERDGTKSPVYISVGLADFPLSGEDKTNLLAAADMALLLAKRRGRNQVAYYRALDQKAG